MSLSSSHRITALLIVLITGSHQASVQQSPPTVCFSDGCVRGITINTYDAFLGIPFAQPPINELRFKNPEPIKPWQWTGILNATTEKPPCMQKNVLFPNPQVQGSEDCLYLYVYRPKDRNPEQLLPVVIYIYGGGFFSGIAGPSINGPDYFMETKEVVMVFLSYRVHVFGFLSTGDSEIPGNFGLKDQALGIKWTVNNIKAFGGDPHKITLMGQSAGAVSAHLHMMSPQTKDLFHRVILMSGVAQTPYAAINRNPSGQARELGLKAGILNAQLLTSKDLHKELLKLSAEDLMAATDNMKIWGAIPAVLFVPVIEDCKFNEVGETTSFLCEDPRILWAKGLHSKVPILAGNTDVEGGVIALAIITNPLAVYSFNSYFGYLLNVILQFWGSSVSINQRNIDKVVQIYMNGTSAINSGNQLGFVKIFTDRYFVEPNLRMFEQYLANNPNNNDTPLYVYKFNFTGPYSYSVNFTGSSTYFGVIHCDELIYTFRSPLMFPDFPENSFETQFRRKWINFLVDFVKNGVVKDFRPCTQYDVIKPHRCAYIYLGRPNRTANQLIMEQRCDQPLKLPSFWGQIDGSQGPTNGCDVFNKSLTSCVDNRYCC